MVPGEAGGFVNSAVTVQFTKPSGEPLPALPDTIPVEWKNPLSHEWENGLWRVFLPVAGNLAALCIALLLPYVGIIRSPVMSLLFCFSGNNPWISAVLTFHSVYRFQDG